MVCLLSDTKTRDRSQPPATACVQCVVLPGNLTVRQVCASADRLFLLVDSARSSAVWIGERDAATALHTVRPLQDLTHKLKPTRACTLTSLGGPQGDIIVATCDSSVFVVTAAACTRIVGIQAHCEFTNAWPHLVDDRTLIILTGDEFAVFDLHNLSAPKGRFFITKLTNRRVPYGDRDGSNFLCRNADGTFTAVAWHDTIEVVVTDASASVLKHFSLEDFPPSALPHSLYTSVCCVRSDLIVMGTKDGNAVWMCLQNGKRLKHEHMLDGGIVVRSVSPTHRTLDS